MPTNLNQHLYSSLHPSWDTFALRPGCTYIYGTSVEDRSFHPEWWEKKATDVTFARFSSFETLAVPDFSRCEVDVNGSKLGLALRGGEGLRAFINNIADASVYIDITGLPHHVWAPLVRATLAEGRSLAVVYVEPASYAYSRAPTEAEIFDLSEQIYGLLPIPGFSTLAEPDNEESVVFVPLLGFEGQRLAYVLEQVQPPGNKTIPVIGVPGFRPEYPFHTYQGNKNILLSNNMHTRVRYAIANSAFSVFYLLQSISEEFPEDLLKVAPIGTKPHALGAIMFALHSKRPVEIVYDHPIRKSGRTTGAANILEYEVSAIFSDGG